MLGLRLDQPLPLEGARARDRCCCARAARGRRPRRACRRGRDAYGGLRRRGAAAPRRRCHSRVARLTPEVMPASDPAGRRARSRVRYGVTAALPANARFCGGWSRSTSRPGSPSGRRSLVERSGMAVSLVHRPQRAGRARSARSADASAHLRGARAHRERLPGLRRGARRHDRRAPGAAQSRRDAERARGGAAVHDRDALGTRLTSWRSSPRLRSSLPRCATSTCSSCSRAPSSSS